MNFNKFEKHSKGYFILILLVILSVITYKYNIENFSEVDVDKLLRVGPVGKKGTRGLKGPSGEDGLRGPQGKPGDNAINIIKKNYYSKSNNSNNIDAYTIIDDLVDYVSEKVKEKLNKTTDFETDQFDDIIKRMYTNERERIILQNRENTATTVATTTQAATFYSEFPDYSIICYNDPRPNRPLSDLTDWQICDGTVLFDTEGNPTNYNTPDLQGRFILGSGLVHVNDADITPSELPEGQTNLNDGIFTRMPGTYTINQKQANGIKGTVYHKLILDEIPNHNHEYIRAWGRWHCWSADKRSNYGDHNKIETNSQTEAREGLNQKHNNTPPFYILAYIIKKPKPIS